MTVRCHKCGTEGSLAAGTTCPKCRTILRRCVDCGHYDLRRSLCAVTNQRVDTGEASYPTFDSPSTYCASYKPAATGA